MSKILHRKRVKIGSDKIEKQELKEYLQRFQPYIEKYKKGEVNNEELIKQYHFAQTEAERIKARDSLIYCNILLVANVARHYIGCGLDVADLMQEGVLGLFIAIDKYDSTVGAKFSTYAVFWIRQQILSAINCRSYNYPFRYPTSVIEVLTVLTKAKRIFLAQNNRFPNAQELWQIVRTFDLESVRQGRINLKTIQAYMPYLGVKVYSIDEEKERTLKEFQEGLDKLLKEVKQELKIQMEEEEKEAMREKIKNYQIENKVPVLSSDGWIQIGTEEYKKDKAGRWRARSRGVTGVPGTFVDKRTVQELELEKWAQELPKESLEDKIRRTIPEDPKVYEFLIQDTQEKLENLVKQEKETCNQGIEICSKKMTESEKQAKLDDIMKELSTRTQKISDLSKKLQAYEAIHYARFVSGHAEPLKGRAKVEYPQPTETQKRLNELTQQIKEQIRAEYKKRGEELESRIDKTKKDLEEAQKGSTGLGWWRRRKFKKEVIKPLKQKLNQLEQKLDSLWKDFEETVDGKAIDRARAQLQKERAERQKEQVI